MKSCWIVTKDHKAVLEWRDIPVPQPKDGEIVLKVHATALNRGEIVVGGVVHGGPEKLGGNEAAGVITAVGAGVTQFKPGDKVFGRVRGGFAEYAIAPAHQILPLPACLSFEQAASIHASHQHVNHRQIGRIICKVEATPNPGPLWKRCQGTLSSIMLQIKLKKGFRGAYCCR